MLTSFFCSSSFFLISAFFLCFKAACHGGNFGLSSIDTVGGVVFVTGVSVFVSVLVVIVLV